MFPRIWCRVVVIKKYLGGNVDFAINALRLFTLSSFAFVGLL